MISFPGFQVIKDTFQKHFGDTSKIRFVRAPGRVNLIGEHTDYNGYPVLPIAIDRDIVIGFAPTGDGIIDGINTDARFARRTFHVSESVHRFDQGDWGNYMKAALCGLIEAGIVVGETLHGFKAVYSGVIPESAGLSSSSALVVATAMAFLAANNINVDRVHLAEVLASAERYAGLEGGGMDQAISLMGEKGKALKIDFFPLRVRPVALPEGYSFVVCNSLVRAPKTELARYAYNRRVVECRLAMALLQKLSAVFTGKNVDAIRLADLSPAQLGLSEEKVFHIAHEAMEGSPHYIDEIAKRLGISIQEVEERYCTLQDGTILRPPSDGFEVWKRYLHVVTEAHRVELAVQELENRNAKAVGELMNQSHTSCRDDYEVSCPELEMLVLLARNHGAIGARLTGAGFGGCTVNLIAKESTEEFLHAMWKEFYKERIADRSNFLNKTHMNNFGLFECRSSDGASVISVS